MLFLYIYSHDIIYILLEVKATILLKKKKKKKKKKNRNLLFDLKSSKVTTQSSSIFSKTPLFLYFLSSNLSKLDRKNFDELKEKILDPTKISSFFPPN